MKYVCEYCNQDFKIQHDCVEHERECGKVEKNIEEQINSQLEYLSKEYNVNFNIDIDVDVTGCEDYGLYNEVWVTGNALMSNGNYFDISYRKNVDEFDYYDFLKTIESEIIPRLSTTYEGFLELKDEKYEDEWPPTYFAVDEVRLDDIANRLKGRKIRIEVIE